ncbi:MAG: polyprenyl synthetase family protein [Elusimicrobia bacterium]|nr:polyprenyl synthetase family protein [Elusimicrobiota bacterium]
MITASTNLPSYLKERKQLIDSSLRVFLPAYLKGPDFLTRAVEYSLFSEAKRFRPILTLAAAEINGCPPQKVLPAACAIEFIHTYSLIHDDLPAMDNDDFRRGKPSSHKAFGEGIAILAGDALLTCAFGLLADNAAVKDLPAGSALRVIQLLATKAGAGGMIAGQAVEIIETQRVKTPKRPSAESFDHSVDDDAPAMENKTGQTQLLDFIYLNKTAALISASAEAGGILSGASREQVEALRIFGENLGFAFQIKDDLMDHQKDASGAPTYPQLYGFSQSRRKAGEKVAQAKDILRKRYEGRADLLCGLADYVLERAD